MNIWNLAGLQLYAGALLCFDFLYKIKRVEQKREIRKDNKSVLSQSNWITWCNLICNIKDWTVSFHNLLIEGLLLRHNGIDKIRCVSQWPTNMFTLSKQILGGWSRQKAFRQSHFDSACCALNWALPLFLSLLLLLYHHFFSVTFNENI